MHDSITLIVKARTSCAGWPSAGWALSDHPSGEKCSETISCEIPVTDPSEAGDEHYLEHLASEHAADLGWRAYQHPGGMRYAPQWYCPRHVALIRAEPDTQDPMRRTGQLKDNLWPD
jgi:hypothetical protein